MIYLFYTLIFFLSIISMYMYDMSKKKYFYIFSFLSMWIPAAIRYSFKGDFSIYSQIFREQSSGVIRTAIVPFEVGYNLLSELISGLNLPFFVLSALISFITYFILFIVLPEERKHIFLSVYMGFYYLESMQTIRVAVCLVFFMLSIRLLLKDRIKSSVVSLILGTLFHRSIVVGFSVFFIKLKKVGFWFISIIIIVFIMRFLNVSLLLLNMVSAYFPGHYAYYLESKGTYISKTENIVSILLGPGFLLKNFVLGIVYFKGSEMIKLNRKNIHIISLSLIYLFFCLMTFEVSILYRIRDIFAVSLLFLYEEIGRLYFPKSKKYSIFIFGIMFLIYIASLKNYLFLEASLIDTTIFMNFKK